MRFKNEDIRQLLNNRVTEELSQNKIIHSSCPPKSRDSSKLQIKLPSPSFVPGGSSSLIPSPLSAIKKQRFGQEGYTSVILSQQAA